MVRRTEPRAHFGHLLTGISVVAWSFGPLIRFVDWISRIDFVATLLGRDDFASTLIAGLRSRLPAGPSFILSTWGQILLCGVGALYIVAAGFLAGRTRRSRGVAKRSPRWGAIGRVIVPVVFVAALVFGQDKATWIPAPVPGPLPLDYPSVPVISPDGGHIAAMIKKRLYVWSCAKERWDSWSISGEGAFWSPDGRTLAYRGEEDRVLYTVGIVSGDGEAIPTADREPVPLAPIPGKNFNGGTWGRNRTILAAVDGRIVHLDLDTPDRVTRFLGEEGEKGEFWFGNPRFLPDGVHFLYTATARPYGPPVMYLGTLAAPAGPALQPVGRPLVPGGSHGEYVEPGYVVSALPGSGRLMVKRLDAVSWDMTGEGSLLGVAVRVDPFTARGAFSASAGSLVYYAAEAGRSRLERVDYGGARRKVFKWGDDAQNPEVSTAACQVAIERSSAGSQRNIWILGLDRESRLRLTSGPGDYFDAVWSPKGDRIMCASNTAPQGSVLELSMVAGETDDPKPFPLTIGGRLFPNSWPEDTWMLVRRVDGLWRAPLTGGRASLLVSHPTASAGQISPDADWTVYQVADEQGPHVLVRRLRGGSIRTVSADGGTRPRWSPNGKEVFFVDRDRRLMAWTFSENGQPKPRLLFKRRISVTLAPGGRGNYFNYDVIPREACDPKGASDSTKPWDFLIAVELEPPKVGYRIKRDWQEPFRQEEPESRATN